ncbi:MAG: methyltransferase family protein, partial [Chitinophagales bacterium]
GTPLPMDCAQKLVVKGSYKIIRNPMAVAGIGQAFSIGLYFGSFLILFYAFSGAILWHIFVRPSEEKNLLERFGKNYLEYRNNTWCWFPFQLLKR